MNGYRVPRRDLAFVLFELLAYEQHYHSLPGLEDVNAELVNAILDESGRFCEEVLAPLNAIGDAHGCRWQDGEVVTPPGFKEAYRQFVEAGWPAMTHSPEYGGQGLPESLGALLTETVGTANWALGMYFGLSQGATKTLHFHGTVHQKQVYLTKLVQGRWTGTMCLTEAHCGSDLGLLKTRAEPQADGSYAITGSKIFISAGEHDLAENIVHIVLARLPDAPGGTRGISLFIVPKYLPDAQGERGERNSVNCGSIEQKMGIHNRTTCVLNFDAATGFLVGPPSRGLNCMFTFMNAARLATSIQGLAHTELGYQKSLAYSRDRLQMRSLSGIKNPAGPADPIIVHPDVRRMLLTQKAFAEGGRMLLYYAAQWEDIGRYSDDPEAVKQATGLLALLTPIAKAFLTETGVESASLAVQCFGGQGYIREAGVEQNLRDARIATIYEGTTGVQALDLLGRKVLADKGVSLGAFFEIIAAFCRSAASNSAMSEFLKPLSGHIREWTELTQRIGAATASDPDELGAASVDYLMYAGYVTLAYLWAQAAFKALAALDGTAAEPEFYRAKLFTARFYFQRILPRTRALVAQIDAGAESLTGLAEEHFSF